MANAPKLTKAPAKVQSTKRPMRAVIYGFPGVGKTQLALTFPRPFIIDTNDGLEGGAVEGRTDLVSQQPKTYRDLEGIYFWLKEHTDDFDTIVFDSLDSLLRLLLNEIVDDEPMSEEVNFAGSESIPQQRDYLAGQNQIERILTLFRQLGKHIVLTSGVRQPKDSDGAPVGKRGIEAPNGICKVVYDWASLIGELAVIRLGDDGKPVREGGSRHRVLFCDPSSEKRECKARWEALQPAVLDPTFQVILDKISKEVK